MENRIIDLETKIAYQDQMLEELNELMTTISNPDLLIKSHRRFSTGYTQAVAAGESTRNPLPVPLKLKCMGMDFGRMEENITCRLAAGKVLPESTCILSLGFSPDTNPEKIKSLTVRINTKLLPEGDWKLLPPERIDSNNPFQSLKDYPREAGLVYTVEVPVELLHEAFNAIEIMPPQIPGSLTWADFAIS